MNPKNLIEPVSVPRAPSEQSDYSKMYPASSYEDDRIVSEILLPDYTNTSDVCVSELSIYPRRVERLLDKAEIESIVIKGQRTNNIARNPSPDDCYKSYFSENGQVLNVELRTAYVAGTISELGNYVKYASRWASALDDITAHAIVRNSSVRNSILHPFKRFGLKMESLVIELFGVKYHTSTGVRRADKIDSEDTVDQQINELFGKR